TGPSSVCPQSTRQFSGPAGMSAYSWSITGSASFSGPTNQQSVSVLSGNVCDETYSLVLNVTSNLCSSSCNQTVTIEDHTPPTIPCAPNSPAECTSAWSFAAPPATDACGSVTITILDTVTNTVGHCGNTFDATRTWRATDACGNTADCSQTVTLVDTTK